MSLQSPKIALYIAAAVAGYNRRAVTSWNQQQELARRPKKRVPRRNRLHRWEDLSA